MDAPHFDVLILGAGAAGLAAARVCLESGINPVVLDKGRNPGGRMCTRRLGEARFDYGAQFFSARRQPLLDWVEYGLRELQIKPWNRTAGLNDNATPVRWIAVDGFRALAQQWAGQHVYVQTQVTGLTHENSFWKVQAQDNRIWIARGVILTFPLPQALALLDNRCSVTIPDTLRQVYYHPCLALMCRTAHPPPWTGWLEPSAPASDAIAFIGDNHHKGLSPVPALTVHCTPGFSAANYSAPTEMILKYVQAALGDLLPPVLESDLMRWRYSRTVNPLDEPFWPFDSEAVPPLALAGDAFGHSRIESAVSSGYAAAQWMLSQIGRC